MMIEDSLVIINGVDIRNVMKSNMEKNMVSREEGHVR